MQQVWRKRWRSTGWIALGAITLVLLISAINKKNHKICNGIEVLFSKDGNNFFVDERGILSILKSFGSIKGEPVDNINLKALEERLKNDRWVANAELYFDNKQVLRVIVEEREPVARIFTVAGNSFYIDSTCRKLQLSEKLSARIPMFTSFPSDRATLSRPDSELLASAKQLAMFIQADEFWKAQVAQIDITTTGFEMMPTVGSHVVALGKDGNWQQKFDRLFSFYKQVWTQVGFEKYGKLDVQFYGQVVATVKGAKPAKIDSVKARMAYENLLDEVKKLDEDTTVAFDDQVSIRNTPKVKYPTIIKPKATVSVAGTGIFPPARIGLKAGPEKAHIKAAPAKMRLPKQIMVKQGVKPSVQKQVSSNKKVGLKKVPKAVMKPSQPMKGEMKKAN